MTLKGTRICFLLLILAGIGLTVSNIDYAEGDYQASNVRLMESTFALAETAESSGLGDVTPYGTSGLPSLAGVETFNYTPALANGTVVLTLVYSDNPVLSGDQFTVQVIADEISDLAGAQFNLLYDTNLVVGIGSPEIGPDFVGTQSPNLCVDQSHIRTDENTGDPTGEYALAFACNEGRTGVNVLLWTVTFQSKAIATEGGESAVLGIGDVLLADGQDDPMPIDDFEIDPDIPALDVDPVQEATIKLVPVQVATGFNTGFTLDIVVDSGDQAVSKAVASIEFDETLLQVVDSVGDETVIEIEPITNSFPDTISNVADNDNGTIDYSSEKSVGPFPSGEFSIARIHFMTADIESEDAIVTIVDMLDSSLVSLVVDDTSEDLVTTAEDSTVTMSPVQPGDCNGINGVTIADFRAVLSELFDGDDNNNPSDAPNGTFAGTIGCDANVNGIITIADGRCVIILLFGLGDCGGQPVPKLFSNSPPTVLGAGYVGVNGVGVESILGLDYKRSGPAVSGDSGEVDLSVERVSSSPESTSGSDPLALDTASLSLMPSILEVHEGQRFTLDISANTQGQPVSGVQAFVEFDPSKLEFRSVSPGTALPQILINKVNESLGTIEIAAGKLTGPLPSTSFVLATVEFVVLQGTPNVDIDISTTLPKVSFADSLGTPFPTDVNGSSIEVIPGIPGDCNGVSGVTIADLRAVILELFDNDGVDRANTLEGSFAGTPIGCDANQNGSISIADGRCVILRAFGSSC